MSDHHRFSTTTTASQSSNPLNSSTKSSSSSTLTPSSPIDKFPPSSSLCDSDSDSDGWQDMPIVHTDELRGGLDEEDQRRYHYRVNEGGSGGSASGGGGKGEGSGSVGGGEGGSRGGGNATGTTLDTDEYGYRWRSNPMQSNTSSSSSTEQHSFTTESNYTRLRHVEEDWEESASVVATSRYLFHDHYALEERGGYAIADDDGKAITPLSQMQQTKGLLSESQRIAYVGLCAVVIQDMIRALTVEETTKVKVKVKQGDGTVGTEVRVVPRKVKGRDGVERGVVKKEVRGAVGSMEVWALKILGRLYYHIGVEPPEQSMIQSLSKHGVRPEDLVPPLVEMKEVVNPEWSYIHDSKISGEEEVPKYITLDMRYTLLTDLFLILIADSVYDSRSRSLLFRVGSHLSLSWWDIVVFEGRIVEAVGAGEGVGESGTSDSDSTDGGGGGLQKSESAVADQVRRLRNRRIALLGLATLGGGLVIGLSAGLLAPVIGVGLGTAFSTVGLTGASTFLAGSAGAAVITTGGVLTGAGIASKGMIRRTQLVRVFDVLPVHQNQRVSCVLCVPGFLNGALDDPRLPFSVLDPVGGDVCAVLWEPEMIRETGGALGILTGEVISQIGQTVLQATVMGALMTALQWPIILTKLGYLIDNPWSNALDRARAAGLVLASVLRSRQLGVRPITLIGFSLGARVIFYALLELAKSGGYGIVQDVFLLGATLSVNTSLWEQTRSVVGGRYVNAYARNDWVLNYLFRASSAASGNVNTVAGLRPIEGVQGLENVDVTDKDVLLFLLLLILLLLHLLLLPYSPHTLLPTLSFSPLSFPHSQSLFLIHLPTLTPSHPYTQIAGHMSYRVYMPVILEELGFKVTERWFDEVEEPDFEGDRVVLPSSSSTSTSTSPDSTNPSTNPDTDTNLSWFARRKAKAAAQKEREQRRKEAEQKRSVAGVQRPPSYASWVGRGKGEKEKGKGKEEKGKEEGKGKGKGEGDEELPPREERDTPPLPTRMASPTPVLGSDSRSSTPTPTPTSNSNTTSSSSATTTSSPSTTPLVVPLNSDHIASPLPKTAGFDFAAIKAELRELSKGVEGVDGIVPAFEAPRVRVDKEQGIQGIQGIEQEEQEEIVEFGPLSSSSSPPPTPPTPPSKSPDAGYFSFPPTTLNTTTSNTPGLTFGSADGERITASSGVGLPDSYLPDPWMVPGTDSDMGRSRTGDVGNPWG
ncbi:uncharacterized protein C8R40DRAFT_823611 [Lentinula edodes]|uniref:uncharacterized protein n=1 Tax=Lentinula edodes TaxID=5353 RepID=UPI001E8EB60A|nr:uncharacterized protein C8R40DRAFT_823611 [Lentinula edodes]KAH7868552.1 hypothetical protein C8R40DRAFT_823611 [Lentinula edodes]